MGALRKEGGVIVLCPECKKPCKPKRCDSGIGPYEFWGEKCNQSLPYIGSDCCEAELEDCEDAFDDSDRGDYEYDLRKDDRLTGD
jgi:hypothetical protein